MIIECPSCKTKFALSATQLSGVANPRFHCSRCGNIFGSPTVDDTTGATTIGPAIATTGSGAAPFYAPNQAEQLALLPQEDKPISFTATETVKSFVDLFENTPEPPIKASWPDSKSDRVYEADMRSTLEKHLGSAPPNVLLNSHRSLRKEPPLNGSAIGTATSSTTTALSSPAVTPVAASSSSLSTQATLLRTAAEELLGQKLEKKAAIVPFRGGSAGISGIFDDIGADVPPAPVTRATSRSRSGLSANVRLSQFALPVAQFCAPPLTVCLALLVFGGNLVESQPVINSLARVVPTTMEKVPPPGLEMMDVRAEYITLEDGTRVLEISGKINNSSEIEVADLKVEAKLFDEQNRAIDRLLINPRNGLAQADKISALDEQTIGELQDRAHRDSAPISPQEVRTFRLVFAQPSDDARWYSARIYSVTPSIAS